MKRRSRLPASAANASGRGCAGTLRVERRTSAALRRARAGDIVVVDHLDLDRGTAEALVEHGVVAVVNASALISGRYPNLGPELLATSGVVMVDQVGAAVFSRLKDGARAEIVDGHVIVGGEPVVSGRRLDLAEVEQLMEAARDGIASQLQSFTHNTTEFLRQEQELLLHGRGVPSLRTDVTGRPVVVVVRDFDYAADLRRLRRFIREQKPVLIGVDGGADALLEARFKPDLVVVGEAGFAQAASAGQSRPVSDKALRAAQEIVLHADASDRVLGADRLDRLGLRAQRISAGGTTEDVALLLAEIKGAATIVTVGTHATLDEFLDRQRGGLASTFLTRLRVGPRIVDAKAVPVLYAGTVRLWHLLLVLLVGLVALAVAVGSTPVGGEWVDDLRAAVDSVVDWIQGLFS